MSRNLGNIQTGVETIPPNERRDIQELVRLSLEEMDLKPRPVPRGVHPKTHGCLFARFEVDEDVPLQLKHGVFSQAATYDALVRFSATSKSDDTEKDARGMAIKVFENGEAIQDFVMIDHPVFGIKNAAHFLAFTRARHKGTRLSKKFPKLLEPAIKGFFVVVFFLRHLKEARITLKILGKPPRNLLHLRYWSTTPYRLGPQQAIKFSAEPISPSGNPDPASAAGDPCHSLRELLKNDLQESEAAFAFKVQLQTNSSTMPIEDATVEWDEKASEFTRVATVRILSQDPGSPGDSCLCDNLSFAPWNTLEEHQPLGGINRVRKAVYQAISKKRICLSE